MGKLEWLEKWNVQKLSKAYGDNKTNRREEKERERERERERESEWETHVNNQSFALFLKKTCVGPCYGQKAQVSSDSGQRKPQTEKLFMQI